MNSDLIMLNILILRGLPGNGKTFLRKMLVLACKKRGLKVEFVNKDLIRKDLGGCLYQFTKANEEEVVETYRRVWCRLVKKKLDVLISDCTNIKQEELKWHFMINYPQEVHFTVLQLGDAASDIRETLPVAVQARMRTDMIESDNFIDAMLTHDLGQLVCIQPRSAIEGGVGELLNEILIN